jgi:hypothetical protein
LSDLGLPPRGLDPDCDRVRALIERAALGDPDVLRMLLVAVLRFLRAKEILPALPISFAEVGELLNPPPGKHALVWAVLTEKRELILMLVDAATKAGVMEKMEALAPDATQEIIDLTVKGPNQ